MSDPISSEVLAQLSARLTARFASKFAPAQSAAQGAPSGRPAYDALHEAAAVLSWFDPGELESKAGAQEPGAADRLLTHSVQTLGADGKRRWTLAPDVRVDVLRQLREGARARAVLEALPGRPEDPLQRAIDRYLIGPPAPVETQSLEELGASLQVCDWLCRVGYEGVPDKRAINRRIEWLILLQPFEHLAGKFFRGRANELRALREYVGVLPPGTAYDSARRFMENILNLDDKPPLVIYGPGGVGKSTLVARFILEHARAHEQDRFPFIYLDFDRPDVAMQEPLTLLVEAVRQLGIEYPEAKERCESIRQGWLALMAGAEPDDLHGSSLTENPRTRAAASSDFANLTDSLGSNDRPVLFVLDTFEEVQWRSEQYVAGIWRLLEALQLAVKRLRVVVVGRANLPGRKTRELPLTGLDEEAAAGYLQARGVADGEVALRLAKQFGGSPLNLQLAADLFQREGLDRSGKLDVETRTFFFSRMEEAVIRRQLYKRVLDHIHKKEVRQLAHPGLLLRRITPELVLEVLAEPCELNISTLREARELFDELRREVSLVTLAPDNALVHRQDLRLLMVELLSSDQPEKVADIHRRAVKYYKRRPPNPVERAEEIYHRLALGQRLDLIDRRWIKGVELHIYNALSEFQGTQRAYLASRLGAETDPETLRAAETPDWENIVGRKARELLAQGRYLEAMELLRERDDRTGASQLFALEAKALARLGLPDDSLGVLLRGYDSALKVGQHWLALRLMLQGAEVILNSGQTRRAKRLAQHLLEMSGMATSQEERLALFSRISALGRFEPSLVHEEQAARARDELLYLFDVVRDSVLARQATLARWASLSFRYEDVGRLSRVLRVTGLPQVNAGVLRHLAAEVTSLDIEVSRERGEEAGALAGELGVPVMGALTSTWTRFVLSESGRSVAGVLAEALKRAAPRTPTRLIDAIGVVMLHGLGLGWRSDIRTESTLTEGPTTPSHGGRPARVTAELGAAVTNALAEAFTPEELKEFLLYRFDRNLDAIARADNMRTLVSSLIEAAERQGWLIDLVAKAHESRPGNAALAECAERLGLSVPSLFDSAPFGLSGVSPAFQDPAVLRERLGAIEAQVCRVEAGGKVFGTGFLVGIDLVMTADFVLSDVHEGKLKPEEVRLRFDYKVDSRGAVVNAGTLFGVSADWLVARREYGEGSGQLGYTILRISASPGAQAVGGFSAETSAALRKWVEVGEQPPVVGYGDGLIIAHHPHGGASKLEIGSAAVAGLSKNGARIYHTLNTLPGSSGAPCFNLNFDAVAFHIGRAPMADPTAREGTSVAVLLSAVVQDLRERNLGSLLDSRFV